MDKGCCQETYFKGDPLHYHIPLFTPDEEYEELHSTEKARLFKTAFGEFWVPIALTRHNGKELFVHKSFKRTYIEEEEVDEILDCRSPFRAQ